MMGPMRLDMSRDECRKCLRCLELDAYGNMVSVLRAQGPFTEDKKQLLTELTKVLHISNERHRAEIRRAVNDEKLSIIAEQLNGPNTWTEWAIEGRRTIPLLPRLKAHSAFTGLANSLSLVITAANEKKPPISEKINSLHENHEKSPEGEIEGRQAESVKNSNCQINTRGRKRKRSIQEASEDVRHKRSTGNTIINHESEVPAVNCEPVEPMDTRETSETQCTDEVPINNSIVRTVSPTNSSESTSLTACPIDAIHEITAITTKSSVLSNASPHLDSETEQLEATDTQLAKENHDFNSDINDSDDLKAEPLENRLVSPTRVETDTNSSCLMNGSISASKSLQILSICNENAELNGPGRPEIESSSPPHRKMSNETLNHLSMTLEDSSSKSDNIVNNCHELTVNSPTKAIENIEEVKLTVAEEEVLEEVFIADDTFCKPIKLGTPSEIREELSPNHCEYTVLENLVENSNYINEVDSKFDDMVVLDVVHDVSNETHSSIIVYEESETYNSNIKTVVTNMDANCYIEDARENCAVPNQQIHIISNDNNIIDDDSENSREMKPMKKVNFESPSKVIEEPVCDEIHMNSNQDIANHDNIISAQTEIYNFTTIESPALYETNTDNLACNAMDEETISLPENEKMEIAAIEQHNDFSKS